MATMRTAPHRQSTAVDDSLRAEMPPERDQCGQCGTFYLLCGPMFGLKIYRHRLFEAGGGLVIPQPEHPEHVWLCSRNGYLPTPERPFMSIHGGKHSRAWQNAACDAMGMPWIKVPAGGNTALGIREVCEAIPPAYAEYIGRVALAHLVGERAA